MDITHPRLPRFSAQPPLRLQILVWLMVALAHAVLIGALLGGPHITPREALLALALATLLAGAHIFPVPVAPHAQISAGTAPAFAAVLLLPLPLALAVSAVGVGVGELVLRRSMLHLGTNVATAVLRTGAAGAVFLHLSPERIGPEGATALAVEGALAAGFMMCAVNAGLVDAVLAVQRRVSPLDDWWRRHGRQFGYEAALYVLGLAIAVIAARHPMALTLLPLPAIAVYQLLRRTADEQLQTRHGLEQLADTIDARLPHTSGRSRHVADLARALAISLRLSTEEVERITLAARVANVGLLGVPARTLAQPDALDEAARQDLRAHPEIGARLLMSFPEYAGCVEIVRAQHERWDGRGYPGILRGEQIPLGARVIAVAEAFIDLLSPRPERPPVPAGAALATLRGDSGAAFDPEVIDALSQVLRARPEFAPPARAARAHPLRG